MRPSSLLFNIQHGLASLHLGFIRHEHCCCAVLHMRGRLSQGTAMWRCSWHCQWQCQIRSSAHRKRARGAEPACARFLTRVCFHAGHELASAFIACAVLLCAKTRMRARLVEHFSVDALSQGADILRSVKRTSGKNYACCQRDNAGCVPPQGRNGRAATCAGVVADTRHG